MTTPTDDRPGTHALSDATRNSFPEVVAHLTRTIGRKLTAYIGGVDDVGSVDHWIQGSSAHGEIEQRLRLAYRLVLTLSAYDRPTVVQGWLTGINPELKDRTPIRLLREEDLEIVGPELLAAAQVFVAVG